MESMINTTCGIKCCDKPSRLCNARFNSIARAEKVRRLGGSGLKTFYGICCLLGAILPYSQLIPWLLKHGIDPSAFIKETAELRIGALAWMDVLISAVALVYFIFQEGRRCQMRKLWIPVLGVALCGVSLGLPLFLLMREMHVGHETLKL